MRQTRQMLYPAVPHGLGPHYDHIAKRVVFTAEGGHGAVPHRVWCATRDFGFDTRYTPDSPDDATVWNMTMPRPPVSRMEYLIEWHHSDGSSTMSPDPAASHRVPGVFGDHSEIRFPEYQVPEWLDTAQKLKATSAAHLEPVGSYAATDPDTGIHIRGELFAPVDSSSRDPLPLLIANDGREFEQFGNILDFLTVVRHRQGLACRVLLLDPIDRDRSYSASPAYSRLLVTQVLPNVQKDFQQANRPIFMGASLGAVSALHAAIQWPDFGGVLLQSGSFFTPQYDQHESGFRFYRRLVNFAESVPHDALKLTDVNVAMTCGTGEENLENNLLLKKSLEKKGIDLRWWENPDAHNYIAWRDCWDPVLVNLMHQTWSKE